MMMRSFNLKEDIGILNGWLSERKIDPVRPIDLPVSGLMATEEEESLGCVFVRHCEGDLGMLCSFEINPRISLRLKDRVFEELLMCSKELAHVRGICRLIALTEKKSIMNRLNKMGWKESHYKIAATALLGGI